MSNQSKPNILVNDLIRVLKNTSFRVNGEQKQRNIQHFINKMQFSGYGKEEIIKVYNKATKIFNEAICNLLNLIHLNVKTAMKVQGVCQGDPLLRQCMEAVLIRNTKPCMNGREEWGNKRNTPRTIHTKTTTSKEHTTRR